jgi:hypothetical protein
MEVVEFNKLKLSPNFKALSGAFKTLRITKSKEVGTCLLRQKKKTLFHVRRTAHHLPLTKNVGLMGRFLSTETSK